jgi:hypothetical protein
MDGQAWQVLRDLGAWQVTRIPRRPQVRHGSAPGADEQDTGTARRVQALVSAFHRGVPVTFGWIRERAEEPVRVLPAGPALAGVTDALLAERDRPGWGEKDLPPSLEDGLLTAWPGPFGWLLLAEPVGSGLLAELTGKVSMVQLGAEHHDSPRAKLTPRRAAARHAELRQAPATGLWTIRLLAGGISPQAAAQVAGLLVFVCGATGAGKSQTVRHLLEAATGAGIPWLAIEPAEAEYLLMAARLPGAEVIRIRPGDREVPPAGINPLEPAAGPGGARFPLQAHADLVRALFLAAFEADEPFPQVLAVALTRCYEDGSCDGQVQAVRRWHDAAQRDQQQVRSVTSGTGQPSAFPDSSWAAGQLRPAEGAET